MHALILGKRSMLAAALTRYFQQNNITFAHISYDDVLKKESTFFSHFTHVFNCVAYTDVENAENNREKAYQINVEFIKFLIDVLNLGDCKLIHYSTDYVFDGKSHLMYTECDSTTPLNVYGQTKREGELKLLELMPQALIVRTSWLYGSGKRNFVEAILEQMLNNECVKIVEDQHGTSTLTDDLAWGSMQLLNESGLFHFANQGVKSRFEWAQEIRKVAEELGFDLKLKQLIPVPSSHFPTKAIRPTFSPLSTEKFVQQTGVSSRSYKEALRTYLTQMKKEVKNAR